MISVLVDLGAPMVTGGNNKCILIITSLKVLLKLTLVSTDEPLVCLFMTQPRKKAWAVSTHTQVF